ncbi:hypothetical protein [Paenibacillus turpanensis]|uniref:hypothetical protein n=1 Tax=Paenibacillus turpanensis TaxID=2689078 RepID=UPI00140A5A11|nr:hypothetical protein [Paenibacillus turpanensis]
MANKVPSIFETVPAGGTALQPASSGGMFDRPAAVVAKSESASTIPPAHSDPSEHIDAILFMVLAFAVITLLLKRNTSK